MLHAFICMLQVFYLDVLFLSRDLECSMQHETDVAADFFFLSLMDG